MTTTRSDAGASQDTWSAEPQPDPLRWRVAAGSGSALVGREADVARIARRLAEAKHSRGSLIAVTGEAGIGKTRLARAMAEMAAQSGFIVIWTRALEGDWQPPFQTWIEVVLQSVAALPVASPDQSAPPGSHRSFPSSRIWVRAFPMSLLWGGLARRRSASGWSTGLVVASVPSRRPTHC